MNNSNTINSIIKEITPLYNKYIGNNWHIANIDSTIILQEPIIKPHVEHMKQNIYKSCLNSDENIDVFIAPEMF